MKAIWHDTILAESDETIVIENNHYFPATSIRNQYFINSETTTECNWKGTASYYSILVNDETNKDAAWYYQSPEKAATEITGYVAFWRGVNIIE